MDWITNIKSFIAVVDANSFTKAAEKRFTSPAGISRHINWLEQHLNATLLIRTTRSLQLTEEGKYFYQKAKLLLADLDEVIQSVQKPQKTLRGPLKISFPIQHIAGSSTNGQIFPRSSLKIYKKAEHTRSM